MASRKLINQISLQAQIKLKYIDFYLVKYELLNKYKTRERRDLNLTGSINQGQKYFLFQVPDPTMNFVFY